ncbi:hypothetical protein GQR58_030173 [Nymphon striatum]|nr:hypothetical protein GQR58_030173 [Nymphon striatum]
MDIQLEFAHAVGTGDGTLNVHLDRAALLVAAAASGPEAAVDIDLELARLDALATGLDATNAAELALELFGGAGFDPELHFGGNHRSYYEVQNSLLPMVLDRRVGIPISLAVLMIEIGRRRAIDLHGVGMPGHFLVGSAMGYIDVFNGGVLLDVAGCEGLFQQLAGPGQRLPENALARTARCHDHSAHASQPGHDRNEPGVAAHVMGDQVIAVGIPRCDPS